MLCFAVADYPSEIPKADNQAPGHQRAVQVRCSLLSVNFVNAKQRFGEFFIHSAGRKASPGPQLERCNSTWLLGGIFFSI